MRVNAKLPAQNLKESAMLRIVLAGVAAVAIGTVGGLTLVAATPAKDPVPQVQLASTTTENVAPTPKRAEPAPVAAPKRAAEAAPTPTSKAQPAPAPAAAPADATPDKPDIRFDGDRVTVRFGRFKIDF